MERILDRIEVFSDVEAAGGTRLAVMNDSISVFDTRAIEGKELLRVEVRRETNSWSSLVERRVLRTVFSDGTFDEWRIAKIRQLRDGSNRLIGSIDCESVKYDLTSTLVSRTEKDNSVNPYFELYGLTPADHLGVILGGDAPSYFSAGTAGSATPRDVVYDWDNPLSAIDALARVAELEISITGTSTGYTVDLPTQVGSTANKVYFRYARNTQGVSRTAETQSAFATRVYPRGGGEQGARPTIADAAWLVTAASSVTITLSTAEGVPVIFADQLNGKYAESTTGKRSLISDTSTAGVVTLAAGHSIAATERVRFRINSSGDELVFIEDPPNVATFGAVQRVVDRSDIPAIDNLIANPFLDDWASSSKPDNWTKVGSAALVESTDANLRRYGTASVRVTTTSSGEGIVSDVAVILPTTSRPFFTAQISLRVVSGTVKLEMIDASSTQDGLYPPLEADPAITTVQDQWVESLGVGGINLEEIVSSSGAQIRVTAYSTIGADFFLDAASLTQTASGVDQFYEGRASNDLWLAGLDYLQVNSVPKVAFDIDVIDLERLHPSVFSEEPIVLGGPVHVIDSDLGLNFETRAIEITRDLNKPGATALKLSNRPEDLSGLGVPGRRPRAIRPQKVPQFRRPVMVLETSSASAASITFQMTGRSDGELLALFFNAHNSTAPVGTFTRRPASLASWKESGFTDFVAVTRPSEGDPAKVLEAYTQTIHGTRSGSVFASVPVQSAAAVITPTVIDDGQTENSTGARSAVRVLDPDGLADILKAKTKIGGAPLTTGFVTVDASPANNSTHVRTVSTTEKHDSMVLWRLGYTEQGSTLNFDWTSPGFDRGNVPDVAVTASVAANGKVSAQWQGDFDTNSVKVIAKSTGNPTHTAIDAASADDGRVGTSTGLITLTDGQTGFVGLLGFNATGGGGTESSTAFFTQIGFVAAAVGAPAITSVDLEVFSTGSNTRYESSYTPSGLDSADKIEIQYEDAGGIASIEIGFAFNSTGDSFLDSTAATSGPNDYFCIIRARDGSTAGPVIATAFSPVVGAQQLSTSP